MLLNFVIVLSTFLLMEFAAWALHKYVMHGLLWTWHKDHHDQHDHVWEKNDRFVLFFAIPSFLLCYFGAQNGIGYQFWIGIGIFIYGFVYFLVHEVFIHQRLPFFKRSNNAYLRAIRKAHKIHHKHLTKEDGECFGMLLVPWKYFEEALRRS